MATPTALTRRARPRPAGGKVSVMIANAGEKISAPPSPWKARARTSSAREGAAPQSIEPTVKVARPASHTGLRVRQVSERQERGRDGDQVRDDYPLGGAADGRAKHVRDQGQADVYRRGVE